ncbi:MAG TPA: hypothetical protein VMS64_27705 [Candidatus Methylomirabilis sp.]|nr:hypothetical protein [Candidatus Methylomirabilis sp.]
MPRQCLGALLLGALIGLSAGPARADRSTIVGNAGTITLDWSATQDRAGRPLIVGHVITYGGKAGYCRARLLVETLDDQGAIIAKNVGFIPGYIGGFDDVFFEQPIRAPGPAYRVSIASWDKCGGGGQ